MEVMNTDMFSQTETLVGRVGKTRAMGVSDDPMLMSMLSTGFYANPLRTMIQEVMFNAWDAHLMGNCQDTPIDIYINDTTGLIIRDYGPGIPDDDIHAVYGIYGNSTKRLDKRQTGGFGLGSKSPFSYTESFTVTSMCEGAKEMYLISRVSDDADGKPGITPLVSTSCEETGLMVTIPLERADRSKAYQYIKDVLYLSGIMANVHSDHTGEDEYETILSKQVRPGEYIMDTRDTTGHKIYAVYGGVRYEIVDKEEYEEEFEFISLISEISNLFIGFAPDSLTPLPNREGLNMSTKTKENIRVGLEMCMEKFQSVFEPLVHAYFRQRFEKYVEDGIEPHFALHHALGVAVMGDRSFMESFSLTMKDLVPFNTDPTVWEIGIRMLKVKTSAIIDVLSQKRWISILSQHFVRCYPNHKQLAFNMLKEPVETMLYDRAYKDVVMETMSCWVQPQQMAELFSFENQMRAYFPDDKAFSSPKIRMCDSNTKFKEVSRNRSAHKKAPRMLSVAEATLAETKITGPSLKTIRSRSYEDPHRIWDHEGREVVQFFMSKTVVISKTVACLNDTVSLLNHKYTRQGMDRAQYASSPCYMIPGYVVHQRKGGYDRAVAILKDMGFEVIEADEPEKRAVMRSADKKTIIPQYYRINTNRSQTGWMGHHIDPSEEDYDPATDGVPLTNPTHYLYVTPSDIGSQSYYRCPNKSLINLMQTCYPDIAMVNNITSAESLKKKGALPFSDAVAEWHSKMGKKIYRLRNIVRVLKIEGKTRMPTSMIQNQIIQKALGIAKIKPEDTGFWAEMAMINNIRESSYEAIGKTQKAMSTTVSQVWDADPQRDFIQNALKRTSVFSENSLSNAWGRLNKSNNERDEFAKRFAHFIRP